MKTFDLGAVCKALSHQARKIAAAVAGRLTRVALWQVPGMDRWGTYLPLSFAAFCYCWWQAGTVYPGYSVAALAFVAVVMTVRADKFSPAERVMWVCIGAALMLAEVRILYTDRISTNIEQGKDRLEQQRRFEETIKNFAVVLERNDATLGTIKGILQETGRTNRLAQESLANITGGASFAVFTMQLSGDPIVFSRGTSNLHKVHVRVLDVITFEDFINHNPTASFAQINNLYDEYDLDDFSPSSSKLLPYIPHAERHGDFMRLNVFFSALNGFWTENFVRWYGDGTTPKIAIRVFRNTTDAHGKTVERVIYTRVDPHFPVDRMGKPRWDE